MKTPKPFFSVIIPSFNRVETLKRAIDSVIKQTHKDFELIVVDDGSTDKTKELCLEYPYLKYIYQTNRGVSAARNLGVSHSSGQWIAFLDSDDRFLKSKLELQYDFILSNPTFRIVHGNEQWIKNGKKINQKKIHQKGGGDQFIPSIDRCVISPSCVCLEKDLYIEMDGFDESFIVCEDYDLWLKITSLYDVGFIEKNLIEKYGGHSDQLSQKYKAMDLYRLRAILWIVVNRNLSKEEVVYLTNVFHKKYEVLHSGFRKYNRQTDLMKLEVMRDQFRAIDLSQK